MINVNKACNLYVDKRTSKKNKTYYCLIAKIQDVEIILSFISEKDYNFIKSISNMP